MLGFGTYTHEKEDDYTMFVLPQIEEDDYTMFILPLIKFLC